MGKSILREQYERFFTCRTQPVITRRFTSTVSNMLPYPDDEQRITSPYR